MLVATAAVIGLDQLTKQLALEYLADAPVDIIKGALTFRLNYNAGGAFGILQGVPAFFLIATVVVAIAIVLWARNVEEPSWGIFLGMVLGGGLGNIIDRIFRSTGGRVVDFIDLHVWPIFNLADSFIVIGVGALLFLSARAERASAKGS
ncbi:MAG TPA: signal peptidase II [Actinomycetota bacterium]|nr:signal peptidase II [Actinomycetota bacterium]